MSITKHDRITATPKKKDKLVLTGNKEGEAFSHVVMKR